MTSQMSTINRIAGKTMSMIHHGIAFMKGTSAVSPYIARNGAIGFLD